MKFPVLFAVSVCTCLYLLSAFSAQANTGIQLAVENSRSDVKTNSSAAQSTICINGECTSTNKGSSKSTICINGKCTTSTNGDVHIRSDKGEINIEINDNTNKKAAQEEELAQQETVIDIQTNRQTFNLNKFIQLELESFKDMFSLRFFR